MAKENGIEIIISTYTFELWFILHFVYTTKIFTLNNNLQSKFIKYIKNYYKIRNAYKQINDMTEQTIQNAKNQKISIRK